MSDDVLLEIQRLARGHRVRITYHAQVRMAQRGVTYGDARCALMTATGAYWQDDRSNWRVDGGVDLDGDDLVVVVDLEADVIVVTVF